MLFTELVVFDAVVELLCFFPGLAEGCFLFTLMVFILLIEILVMILAFFDDFGEVTFLDFGRFF